MKNIKKQKFLWGVVNIGQQTEGNNYNSDWSKWASRDQVPRIGGANDYWNQYKAFHKLAQGIGCNSFRLSIEWSRIEPHEGVFDVEALEHYRKIINDIRTNNMDVVVGLWHWSIPIWFEEKYGMHSGKCVDLFMHFVDYICSELGEAIDVVVILNEPSVYVATSYVGGTRPPFLKSLTKSMLVKHNLIKIHKLAYNKWKQKFPHALVGSTFLYNDEQGAQNTTMQNRYLKGKRFLQNGSMMRKLSKHSDYIGVNYYTSDNFFFGRSGGRWGVHGTNNWHSPDVWHTFAKGLYRVLMELKKYNKPIFIMENGKPTVPGVDDKDRQKLLKDTIGYIQKAISEGVDVAGYFHYSLVDSYEWDSGYDFKFGLVEIDRETGQVVKRESYDVYKDIIQKNIIS